MNSHIVIVAGEAGSGKDTVAAMIHRHFNANVALIAQADPMKRFARDAFGFTEEQLWGPSECRNAKDLRFAIKQYRELQVEQLWEAAEEHVFRSKGWLEDILVRGQGNVAGLEQAHTLMLTWLRTTRYHCDQVGFVTPRYVLQTFGTEFGRKLGADLWSNVAMSTARETLLGGCIYNRTAGIIGGSNRTFDLAVITDGRYRNEILNTLSQNGVAIRVVNPAPSNDKVAVAAAGVKNHQSEAELSKIPNHFFHVVIMNDKTRGLSYLEQQVSYAMSTLFSPKVID